MNWKKFLLNLCIVSISGLDQSIWNRFKQHLSTNKFNLIKNNINLSPRILKQFIVSVIPLSFLIPAHAGFLSELNKPPLQLSQLKSIKDIPRPRLSPRLHAYSVEFTDPPSLLPRTAAGERSVIDKLTLSDVVLLGKHDNSFKDQFLTSQLISRIEEQAHNSRSLLLALTELPCTAECQMVLDRYMKSDNKEQALNDLKQNLQAEGVDEQVITDLIPSLSMAKEKRVKPVAVGFTASSKSELIDSEGFLQSTKSDGFTRYLDVAVHEDYDKVLAKLGSATPSFQEYVSYRLLIDESVSSSIAKLVSQSSDNTVIVLAELPRVKFGYGLQERILRNINKLRQERNEPSGIVYSVIMNPTPQDTGGETAQLRLTLAYGKDLPSQRPFANFIWYTDDPPVKYLTHPKNPISKEGDKPAGESSIIGAF